MPEINDTRLPGPGFGAAAPSSRWIHQELAAIEAKLHAASVTLASGVVPRPAIRSAAVALVALDAALRDDLDLVRAMPGEVVT